jgi:hypothetical protein
MGVLFLLPDQLEIANFCGKAFLAVYSFIFLKYFTFKSVVDGGGKGQALLYFLFLIQF